MQINLRKANALQHDIRAALKSKRVNTRISVTEFESGEEAIDAARKSFEDNLGNSLDLTAALFEIRKLVGEKNQLAGINDALVRIAEIGDQLSLLSPIMAETGQRLDAKVLQGKLEKLKEPAKDAQPYYGNATDAVTTGIFSDYDLKNAKTQIDALKREKRDLQDRLLALNVENTITLSDVAKATLTAEGII